MTSKPPSGRMKARAPPPPPPQAPQPTPQPAPRHIFKNTSSDGGGKSGVDAKENMPNVDFKLTLPQGYQTSLTEEGSKALMDLLVELCSRYHLNPALHTLELLSPEGHTLGFKPNALLGSLNVACVLIKEKVWEEKVVRRPAPKVPEKTVRLMVNYHGSQKAVVRVNPLVPLHALTPVICDKCEFDPAHVLLLKDSISRRELPLDKSLSELGIKELYVHDQTLDSIHSSTTSLGRADKKGLLGIFPFSRRKSKTETTSVDMDDYDDKLIQNTDTQSNGLSTVSGVPSVGDRPGTLGQSQSVMNMPNMSPKTESKKRRAPAPPEAPTPIMGHTRVESYQMGPGSESQQRKRKAPAPPPTPTSVTPGSDDTLTSAASTPDIPVTELYARVVRTKVTSSIPTPSSTVVVQTVKPVHSKTAVQPTTSTASSPTPSSSTIDSQAVQDSSSELSHSLDDSDVDLDQAGSSCSTLTSSTVGGSVQVQPVTKTSSSRMEESERSSSMAAKSNQEETSDSSSRLETESALNLKLDEVENNRHSGMAWLHSMRTSTVSGQKPETETPEEETLSVGSSSSGSSLPDQGYAASEGMVEGEDSGMVSSPSDTQPTSPDGSLSLDGSSGGGGEKQLEPVRDSSSDSDEGCATWGSRQGRKDISPQSGKFKEGYEDDSGLTAQLHQTLADFEANLADHLDIVSAKETPYTISTDSNEVPVSVVDMDVPVTAIDEVLEDYDHNFVESNAKSLTRTVSNGRKGFCHQSSSEPQNKNNNACTAEQCRNSVENKSIGDKKREKITETKMREMSITNSVAEDKQRPTSAMKSHVDVQKQSKSSEIKSNPVKSNAQSFEDKKPVLPPNSQRSVSRVQDMHEVQQNNSSIKSSHGQITQNVTSRFGMKTFTVVPPKPSIVHAASGDSAAHLISSAIKIDDQGNMVKAGVSQNKVGGSSESRINGNNEFPSLGNTKAFWSLNERQESVKVPHSKSLMAKGNNDGPTSAPNKHIATSEMPWKTNNTEYLKTTQSTMYKPADRTQPKEIKEEAKELKADMHVAKEKQVEVDSKISVPKIVQQPSNKPAVLPPLLPDPKRDLSFLRPSRRTSSHYVASAISRYAPKTSAKPTPNVPASSALVKTQTVGFQRSGRSIQVNPHQSSQSSSSDNKENDSASKPNPSGPKRYPECASDSQRNFGEVRPDKGGFGGCVESTKGSSSTLEAEMAKNKHIQSRGPSQTNVTANNDRDDIKHIQPRSPNPAQSSPPHSSAKPPTAPKTIPQSQTSNTTDMAKAATCLTPDARPQPSVTVSEDSDISQPVTVFGPVQKFRPVICRSVEKETSLHSSLMEAIQTGGGRERLKKISTSGPSSMNKASYAEGNERSALLAAIRAQSNSSKLKKTKSEAAHELEKFRKVASEEKSADPPFSPPPLVTPPPPPPPPVPTVAPPPPVLPQGKPSTVANSSANTPLNPALAREAMLEAIRSGSAAERLKKIAVPQKTVQVNGRLGTIQATSSAPPQQ